MSIFLDFFNRPFNKKIIVLIIVVIALFLLRSQLTFLLLTFIFISLIDSLQKSISNMFIKSNDKLIIVFLYFLIAGLFFLLIYKYVPLIIQQTSDIVDSITGFLLNAQFPVTENRIINYITEQIDIQKVTNNIGLTVFGIISNISSVSLNILVALILSFFFLLEKERVLGFVRCFETSKIYWIYDELKFFGIKFANSFGKVIQTQILISFINSMISVVFLSIFQFPNIVGLFIIILLLGMIPVAGVILSLIPLSIIAYTVGGVDYIIGTFILIAILHALESYILNPQLMSQKTKLPVFVTFLVLILSEHFMGIWGLIVGIPITMFILDVLEVKFESQKPS